MKALLLTSEEQSSFTQALQYGRAYIETLNPYQKARLQDFAQEKLEEAQRTALALLERNPGYSYPPECEGVKRGQYWLERVTAYKPTVTILSLLAETTAPIVKANKLASPSADSWAGLLQRGYTVADLDRLLVKVGLLENADNRNTTDEAKPRTWVAIREALVKQEFLIETNKFAVARAFIQRYGKIANTRSLQRSYEGGNADAKRIFDLATRLLTAN